MSKTFIFERKIEFRLGGENVRMERIGVNKIRLYTGKTDNFDFNNTMRREQFDRNFINALNQVLKEDKQLDIEDRDVERRMDGVRESLERDDNKIIFKITFRMLH
ncbi:MAG: hypothetical protein U9M90_04420 [Patescibacteria group bacterium]|nr:hypothetical protein [Patescibacteria group bacterium]